MGRVGAWVGLGEGGGWVGEWVRGAGRRVGWVGEGRDWEKGVGRVGGRRVG